MRGWSELWHQFIVTLTQQPVIVVLGVWTGLALVLVMALEGLLLNLFPGLVFHRYLEKMPHRKAKESGEPAPTSLAMPLAMLKPAPVAGPPVVPTEIAAPAPVPVASDTPSETSAKLRAFKPRNPKKPAPAPALSAWPSSGALPL